jgi:rSAM/selenodomain-associated transferase 1
MNHSGAGAGRLRPAVAVMAKAPGLTPVKSRLHAALSAGRATDLYRCFLLDRLDALLAVSAVDPFVAFTPADAGDAMAALAPAGFRLVAQRGDDLGQRLINLLGDLLDAGHPGAIALDSDSPTLPMGYVEEAARVLATDAADVVVGPSDDGGYYLVGVRAPRPALFEGIPWSTDRVLARTQEAARRLGLRVHVLAGRFDVDTAEDLRRLRDEMEAAGGGPPRTLALVRDLYRSA